MLIATLCQSLEGRQIRVVVQDQITGLLGHIGPALYLADQRQGDSALGPALVEPALGFGRVTGAIAE